jgi:hypothetical protein
MAEPTTTPTPEPVLTPPPPHDRLAKRVFKRPMHVAAVFGGIPVFALVVFVAFIALPGIDAHVGLDGWGDLWHAMQLLLVGALILAATWFTKLIFLHDLSRDEETRLAMVILGRDLRARRGAIILRVLDRLEWLACLGFWFAVVRWLA